jgi:hypothetical protein
MTPSDPEPDEMPEATTTNTDDDPAFEDDQTREHEDVYAHEADHDDGWSDEELPPRPKRRLVTPLTASLAGILLVALGFLGGVEVQKHSSSSSASTAGTGGFGARAGGFPGAGAAAGGGGATTGAGAAAGGGTTSTAAPTAGTVASKDGRTLYVKNTDGTTVKVKTDGNSKVTRNATATVGQIHPGDTVIVQGAKSSSGTLVATQITATASGVSAFAGLGGGFAGGARGGAGTGGTAGAGAGGGFPGGPPAGGPPTGG